MTSPCYRAYGLQLRSELPLPELNPGGDGADAQIRAGHVELTDVDQGNQMYGELTADRALLAFPALGTFLVQSGTEIVVDADAAATPQALRLHLLGSCLGLLLQQRGQLVLHACAMELSGKAVALIGESGAGKSTLGAALACRGHGLMGDDLTTVDLTSAVPLVRQGPGRLKLRPDSVAALELQRHERISSDDDGSDKQILTLPRRSSGSRAMALRAVVLLGRRCPGDLLPLRLSAQQGLAALIRHTYRINWYSRALQVEHFDRCVRLAKQTPVYRLELPRGLARLDEAARSVERMMRSLG